MRALLERLKSEADVIILDSPPTLAVTDATVLAAQVDGVVLVTDSGRTRRNLALRARDTLKKVGANILGATVNRVKDRGGSSYYYYYYYGRGAGKPSKKGPEPGRRA